MMALTDKPLRDITHEDIQALLDEAVPEDRDLDYKETSYEPGDKGAKALQTDVTAFANTAGGHIILGVKEVDRVPTAIVGVTVENMDRELLRLQQIVNSNIEPRVQGVDYRPVAFPDGRQVVAIRIPRSWIGPHAVAVNDGFRFYLRGVGINYPLDIQQVRSLFLGSEAVGEKIRAFRTERLGQILSDQTPVVLSELPRLVLHLVPVEAFTDRHQPPIEGVDRMEIARPISGHHSGSWTNFDGIVVALEGEKKNFGYLQVYRDGRMEAVTSNVFAEEHHLLYESYLGAQLVDAVGRYVQVQRHLGVRPPIVMMVSLLNVRGFSMKVERQLVESRTIDRDHLVIDDVLIDSLDDDPREIVRPILDAIWRATGFPTCYLYDDPEWPKSLHG